MNGLENRAGGSFSASSRPSWRNAASGTARAVAAVRAPSAARRHFNAEAVTCNSFAAAFSRAISAACPSPDQRPNRASVSAGISTAAAKAPPPRGARPEAAQYPIPGSDDARAVLYMQGASAATGWGAGDEDGVEGEGAAGADEEGVEVEAFDGGGVGGGEEREAGEGRREGVERDRNREPAPVRVSRSAPSKPFLEVLAQRESQRRWRHQSFPAGSGTATGLHRQATTRPGASAGRRSCPSAEATSVHDGYRAPGQVRAVAVARARPSRHDTAGPVWQGSASAAWTKRTRSALGCSCMLIGSAGSFVRPRGACPLLSRQHCMFEILSFSVLF